MVGKPPFGALDQVVAAAEALARTGQQQHVHLAVAVGALDAALELAQQLERDPVSARGPVQGDPRDPAGYLVVNIAHTGSARSMIALASTPVGSVPYTRPPSPARRDAQNASATAGGACLTSSEACS